MESPTSSEPERVTFVENIAVGGHLSTFHDALRVTLQRVEHESPGTVASVRVNVVRRMTVPEVARLKLDPAVGTWFEVTGDVLRVPGTR
jgi:hypothetical protein